jgi:hypothetical protein
MSISDDADPDALITRLAGPLLPADEIWVARFFDGEVAGTCDVVEFAATIYGQPANPRYRPLVYPAPGSP